MKNEDKIIELLAESLQRQDRHEDILREQQDILKKILGIQEKLADQFHRMNEHLLTKQEKMEDRISRLEDKVFKR